MSLKKSTCCSKVDNVMFEMTPTCISLLDLPDLVLECILEKIPPQGLCTMASVCRSLKERCTDDYLWEMHMKQKWGKIVGAAAHREWEWQIASRKDSTMFNNQIKPKGILNYLSHIWPFSLVKSNNCLIKEKKTSPPVDSVMSKYLAFESGKFWFPAQVSNRENGQSGFMLSCYDAEVSYNPINDTFQARYPSYGNRAIAMEIGVTWDRLRSPPVDTPPHDLHISDCLYDLYPGDHIEIQWRKNKEFPYGWWYGVVGHMESCDGSFCHCHKTDTVIMEFKQYSIGSRWRRTTVNRKNHREEGNEADGFYGGIRKLDSNAEILSWKKLWPAQNLE